jgi:hypothetical protein
MGSKCIDPSPESHSASPSHSPLHAMYSLYQSQGDPYAVNVMSKQRYLTLAFDDRETVKILPQTFAVSSSPFHQSSLLHILRSATILGCRGNGVGLGPASPWGLLSPSDTCGICIYPGLPSRARYAPAIVLSTAADCLVTKGLTCISQARIPTSLPKLRMACVWKSSRMHLLPRRWLFPRTI